ncbi:FmdB family zinc ribbon protein [Cellulomonas sp. PhB143]|uniref:FmdB family zinc ribbon protein n=1 Tax=Cellulomonas sp. PhB143 TaxID=2485186 RepID=UPI000F48B467|nr:FmdB family zinc ribbon protein [Cellulomonas sp. PhB143]ROS78724.1 putative FmdB family regulatory protein [Cellulomonas sp. PhB143]
MPTYAYACTACDHRFDIHQSFTDDALTTCPVCGGRLRKVFSSVGVTFKGSGFYRTDSRSGSGSRSGGGSTTAKSGSKDGGSGSSSGSGSSGSGSSSGGSGSSTSGSGSSSSPSGASSSSSSSSPSD